jgi:hypothetical protein
LSWTFSPHHHRQHELRKRRQFLMLQTMPVKARRQLTVDDHARVLHNRLDQALLLEVLDGLSGKRAVNLETIDEHGNGDETVGLHVFVERLLGGLVEDDGVIGLVLDCSSSQNSFSL